MEYRCLFLTWFFFICAAEPHCSESTSGSFFWNNLKNVLYKETGEWFHYVANGTHLHAQTCPYKMLGDPSCDELSVASTYDTLHVLGLVPRLRWIESWIATNATALERNLCVFVSCSGVVHIQKTRAPSFRTVDCRKATRLLQCAASNFIFYQIPLFCKLFVGSVVALLAISCIHVLVVR